MYIFKNRKRIERKKIYNKAQTTFFVIAGLILFVAALAGLLVYNNIKQSKIEEQAKKTANMGLQADEVKKFVNDCIRKESFEGLKTMGQTGGYLNVPKLIDFKGTAMWQID